MTRRLNLVFLAVLLGAATVVGLGMRLVHDLQVRRNASALLDRARRAQAVDDLEKAEQSLSQYLKIRHDDGPAWEWYARVVDQHDAEHRQRERVLLVHEQALQYNPGDLKLVRRSAELAMELARSGNEPRWYDVAQRHLANLIEELSRNSPAQPVAGDLADVEDLLGQCNTKLSRFAEAEKWFLLSLQHDPARVACYDRLARLRREQAGRLRKYEVADATIEEMVAKNPKAGLAYVYRWRYAQDFLESGDSSDVWKAVQLPPDNPEVQVAAGVASEQKGDAAAARKYFERGWTLDRKNLDAALGLARLLSREGHVERTEAILRQAFQANPSVSLAFELAENLILQDKIEGKDQAADYISLLRDSGFADTLVVYLEAEILLRRQSWAEAIPKIKLARTVLGADRRLTVKLDLMLAECYGQLGSDDDRLTILRKVAEDDRTLESVRVELARGLARSGRLDQAIAALSPLVDRRPELRLDLTRLLIQRTSRRPKSEQDWREAEAYLRDSERRSPRLSRRSRS